MSCVTETLPFLRNFDVSLLTIAHRLVTIADYDKVPGQQGTGRGLSEKPQKLSSGGHR